MRTRDILIFTLGFYVFVGMGNALADSPVLKYEVSENSKIVSTCKSNGATERSRFKLVVEDKKSGEAFRSVKLKARICTKDYGFRTIKIWVNMPERLFDDAFLSDLRIKTKESFSGIPSTNVKDRLLTLELNKRANVTLDNSVLGRVPASRIDISWPNRPQDNDEYETITLSVVDPRHMSGVNGFRESFHEPWPELIFRQKTIVGNFELAGKLVEAEVE